MLSPVIVPPSGTSPQLGVRNEVEEKDYTHIIVELFLYNALLKLDCSNAFDLVIKCFFVFLLILIFTAESLPPPLFFPLLLHCIPK